MMKKMFLLLWSLNKLSFSSRVEEKKQLKTQRPPANPSLLLHRNNSGTFLSLGTFCWRTCFCPKSIPHHLLCFSFSLWPAKGRHQGPVKLWWKKVLVNFEVLKTDSPNSKTVSILLFLFVFSSFGGFLLFCLFLLINNSTKQVKGSEVKNQTKKTCLVNASNV